MVFVNEAVKSDARLPSGGVKEASAILRTSSGVSVSTAPTG